MKEKYKNIILDITIGLLIISGILCLLASPIQNHLIDSYQPHVTRREVLANTEKPKNVNYDFSQVKSVSPISVAEARWHAKNNHYVGEILAPAIGVHLPIGLGVDNNLLMLAAGTMRANMQMGKGNYALAGHHMKDNHVLFSPFYAKAKEGMDVYITDMKTLYHYKIYKREIIAPTDVNVINNTKKPILTLITCNDSGSERLLTQAKLTSKVALKNAPHTIVTMLNKATNNHNVLKGY